jgi:solute carrier family 13 (sodium-dependent dicarboxylate transporter), member 2/3/5
LKPVSPTLRNQLAVGAGLLLFFVLLFFNPLQVDAKAAKVLAVAALMITWWVSEALPMPAVALIPLVLFPLMNIMPVKEAASSYADNNIFLFMGGFMLGLAIEKWNLHKRIALSIVNITGTSGNRIVLGFILATGLLSMWLSNTATTMMMYPIAASVIRVVKENHSGKARLDNLAICIMLAIAYASNFGGIATIVGTPPNVAFAGFIRDKYNYTIQFADWLLLCAPMSLLLLFSLYFVMTKWLYPNRLEADNNTRQLIRYELQQLGPLSASEKRVMTIFVATALLWIFKDLINKLNSITLDDTMIAMAGALALFICPAGNNNKADDKPAEGYSKILEWSDTSKMAWGILLLFGGGIALAGALEKAGLIKALGSWIAGFSGSGGLMLVFMIALVSLFISEIMSNIAQVIVFSPVIGGIADAMHINPILLGLPMCLAASCASMMPMGTPPNAIVFASGHIKFNQMIKAGFVMNLIAVILITLFCWYLVPLLMKAA